MTKVTLSLIVLAAACCAQAVPLEPHVDGGKGAGDQTLKERILSVRPVRQPDTLQPSTVSFQSNALPVVLPTQAPYNYPYSYYGYPYGYPQNYQSLVQYPEYSSLYNAASTRGCGNVCSVNPYSGVTAPTASAAAYPGALVSSVSNPALAAQFSALLQTNPLSVSPLASNPALAVLFPNGGTTLNSGLTTLNPGLLAGGQVGQFAVPRGVTAFNSGLLSGGQVSQLTVPGGVTLNPGVLSGGQFNQFTVPSGVTTLNPGLLANGQLNQLVAGQYGQYIAPGGVTTLSNPVLPGQYYNPGGVASGSVYGGGLSAFSNSLGYLPAYSTGVVGGTNSPSYFTSGQVTVEPFTQTGAAAPTFLKLPANAN